MASLAANLSLVNSAALYCAFFSLMLLANDSKPFNSLFDALCAALAERAASDSALLLLGASAFSFKLAIAWSRSFFNSFVLTVSPSYVFNDGAYFKLIASIESLSWFFLLKLAGFLFSVSVNFCASNPACLFCAAMPPDLATAAAISSSACRLAISALIKRISVKSVLPPNVRLGAPSDFFNLARASAKSRHLF